MRRTLSLQPLPVGGIQIEMVEYHNKDGSASVDVGTPIIHPDFKEIEDPNVPGKADIVNDIAVIPLKERFPDTVTPLPVSTTLLPSVNASA